MSLTPPVMETTDAKVAEAADVLRRLIEGGHASAEPLRVALYVVCTYMKIIRLLCQRGIGIKMLRERLGITVAAPEDSPAAAQKSGESKDKKGKKGRHNHGRRGSAQFPQAQHRFFAHPTLDEPGTPCSGCEGGGLYPHFGQWHRFEGQPFLRVLIVNYEIWRCTLCQESHPAPVAQDIVADGKERQVFGFSATSLIVISKYFLRTPWARQERLQEWLELPLPASTACDQTHRFAEIISPVYEFLKRFAANAWLFYSDDTSIRIIRLKQAIIKQRKTQKETLRTGVHTSVILAKLDADREVALFKSGILHAGEFIDEILRHRDEGLAPPLHMADGSSCNPATVEPAPILCACNAHGRRKLDEKQTLYPEHWEVMRLIYRDVYKFDAETKRLLMTPEQRLAYHREHSLPLMEKLFAWMQKELTDKNVEPNSQLGGIFEYFLARQKPLMGVFSAKRDHAHARKASVSTQTLLGCSD